MDKIGKITRLKNNKTQKAIFLLNEELWRMFKDTCKENESKPTWELEKWVLTYLNQNGKL